MPTCQEMKCKHKRLADAWGDADYIWQLLHDPKMRTPNGKSWSQRMIARHYKVSEPTITTIANQFAEERSAQIRALQGVEIK